MPADSKRSRSYRKSDDGRAGSWKRRNDPEAERVGAAVCVEGQTLDEAAASAARVLMRTAMDRAKVSRTELARRLGVTQGRVTQILDYANNFTIKTLVDVLFACGFLLDIKIRVPDHHGQNP